MIPCILWHLQTDKMEKLVPVEVLAEEVELTLNKVIKDMCESSKKERNK